jgi:mobilization protein NikA
MANYSAKGRPKLPKGQKLGQIIQFRMTAEERKRCEGAAKKAGGKLSEWIRQTLLEAAGKG